MGKSPTYEWSTAFFGELANKRKLALRMGQIQERESGFRVKAKSMNKLCRGEIRVDQLTERDFEPDFIQKGSRGMMHCWGAMEFVPEAKTVRCEYFAALK